MDPKTAPPIVPAFFTCALLACVSVSVAGEVDSNGHWELGAPVEGGETIELPKADRNITAAYFSDDPQRSPLVTELVPEGGKVSLIVPPGDGGAVVLEVAEESEQFPEGRIVFSALDAKVAGDRAKLETHPGNHRIGFWSSIDDTVGWSYKATRPGMYEVELSYSLAGGAENRVQISVGGEKVAGSMSPTGSWYRYTVAKLGRIYIEKAGPVEVQVKGLELNAAALMNLKAVTLRPAPEGKPVVQAADGTIEIDSSAATVHSTKMQYERNPKKLCLGFWVNPADWASFTFTLKKPGKYRVELTQGCGGSGGSEVDLIAGGKTIPFVVEGTGGFQNWKARDLGEVHFAEAGEQRLEVRPRTKKGGAVMDIRRIWMLPVD